jgi:hypothetical protein
VRRPPSLISSSTSLPLDIVLPKPILGPKKTNNVESASDSDKEHTGSSDGDRWKTMIRLDYWPFLVLIDVK